MSGSRSRAPRSLSARNASKNYKGERVSYTELSTSSSESDAEKSPVPVHKTRRKASPKKYSHKRARLADASDSEEDDDADGVTPDEEEKESTSDSGEEAKVTSRVKRDDKEQKKEKKKGKKEKKTGRKKIKKILGDEDLKEETREAAKEEMERLKRLKELEEIDEEEEDVTGSAEKKAQGPSLVVQRNPYVEVSPYLASKLRPHQIEGVRFIWKNLIESTERAKTSPGGGCILAHCMGLGKTLQTIASVHTFLKCKHLSFRRALVVAPLNTVRNWISEFEQWCEQRDSLNLYNFADPKTNKARIGMLRLWQKNGGVLIMGYDMYRIMLSRLKYAQWKKTACEALVDPGPDIVVCDEGHMLKNSESHISKQINKIKTKRRLALTGTPLQNNLVEYHCMVNFVKPDLLGSLKEFRNRFVNPIVNGQHIDSTDHDVKVMKKRSHVLHQMLEGFVQRKDYTALKPYLSSKFEYVLKVRLTPLQIKLYRHYLDTMTNKGINSSVVNSYGKGTSLFADYQILMRVWTHPKSLLLHTVKREKLLARQEMNDLLARADEGIISEDEYEESSSSEEDSWGRRKKHKPKDKDVEAENIESTSSESEEDIESSDSEEVTSKRKKDTGTKVKRKAVIKASSGESENEEKKSNESGEESATDGESEEKLPQRHTRSVASQKESDRKKRYRLRCAESSSESEDNRLDLEADFTTKEPSEPQWYNDVLPEDKKSLEDYQNSLKIVLLFEVLRLSEERREKVLVFSQSLISLDLIEEMLEFAPRSSLIQSSSSSSEDEAVHIKRRRWKKNVDYYRMDGATQGHHRQKWINAFNDENNTRSRLFLISTRAGSLGVNLVGANRVVIFDASWNPSHDTQSMFRVYRFGQKKKCYIYRFIAEGTMEEKIYQRQVNKQSLAFRVVDEQQINRHFTASSLAEMYTFEPTLPDASKTEPTPVVPKDDVLAEILLDPRTKRMISSFHEHDSLLDHQVDEELTEEERKAAWEEYEMAKATGYEASKPNHNSRHQQYWNTMNNAGGGFNFPLASSKESTAKSIEHTAGLIARLSKVVANAFYQYQVCEVKPIESIIQHLKETPLYATSNDETITAIAHEVNFRLEMQRSEKFTTFQNLQIQLRQLQAQYFKLVGGGNFGNANQMNQQFSDSAVFMPSKADLLMQLSGSSGTASVVNGRAAGRPVVTKTTISEVIEIDDDDDSQGTSENADK